MNQQQPNELLVGMSEELTVLDPHNRVSTFARRSIEKVLIDYIEQDCLEIPRLRVQSTNAVPHLQLKEAQNPLFT